MTQGPLHHCPKCGENYRILQDGELVMHVCKPHEFHPPCKDCPVCSLCGQNLPAVDN